MKFLLIAILFFFVSNCSLNSDSKYWTESVKKNILNQKKNELIKLKSKNITSMTMEEYELYLEGFTKNSKYPDLKK